MDQRQRFLIEPVEAGAFLKNGRQHPALPVHGEAQQGDALLAADLRRGGIALDPPSSRPCQVGTALEDGAATAGAGGAAGCGGAVAAAATGVS